MYIKVFESRQSSRWYIINQTYSYEGDTKHTIEDAAHNKIDVTEEELFKLIEKFIQGKQNEKVQEHE